LLSTNTKLSIHLSAANGAKRNEASALRAHFANARVWRLLSSKGTRCAKNATYHFARNDINNFA